MWPHVPLQPDEKGNIGCHLLLLSANFLQHHPCILISPAAAAAANAAKKLLMLPLLPWFLL